MYNSTNEVRKQIADQIYARVQAEVRQTCPNAGIDREMMTKLNEQRDAVIIRSNPGDRVGIVLYVDRYAEAVADGDMTLEQATDKLVGRWEEHRNDSLPDINLDDSEAVKSSLYCIVASKERNAEVLPRVPHRDIPGTDLCLLMRGKVMEDDRGRGSYLVENSMLGRFGLTESEAFEIAMANTMSESYSVKSMTDALRDMGVPDDMLEMAEAAGPRMYVITNGQANGATGIFASRELRQEVRDTFLDAGGSGEFFILPSSVHEVLALDADGVNPEMLSDMIKNVNGQLAPGEILGDKPYFCSEELQISMPTEMSDSVAESLTDSVGAHL